MRANWMYQYKVFNRKKNGSHLSLNAWEITKCQYSIKQPVSKKYLFVLKISIQLLEWNSNLLLYQTFSYKDR